ncbi:hypothetical protein D3C72_2258830 [compost metagenome]
MAKSLIDHNKIDSLETVFEKINAVTTNQVQQVVDEVLDIDRLNIFTFSPIAE